MQTTHTLTCCPLYKLASTLTLDTDSRTITHASISLIELLDNQDPTGTRWPTKEDQQLCFTTLVTLNNSSGRPRQKRLLTCEHANSDGTTTILCADISALEQVYCSNNGYFSSMTQTTMILRMNPYGVIQSVFSPTAPSNAMIGQPLMRFIHNDDIPILCNKLRQVTRYQQDIDEDDTEFTSISFDIRCDLTSIFNNKHATKSILEKDTTTFLNDDDVDHTMLYHFTTVVTSTQDIICVMRPFNSGLPRTNTSFQPSNPTSLMTSFYRLSQILKSSSYKLKHILQQLQQALWDAAEQGLMIVAHYLAMVMVLTLQYYQLARHPSFWLETSELALRCLVAETKSRSELHPVLSWIPSHRLFGRALDHGSGWLISSLSSSHLSL